MSICRKSAVSVALATLSWLVALAQQASGQLRVSENHRYLTYADGKRFFYLGDAAWELFHRTTREAAEKPAS